MSKNTKFLNVVVRSVLVTVLGAGNHADAMTWFSSLVWPDPVPAATPVAVTKTTGDTPVMVEPELVVDEGFPATLPVSAPTLAKASVGEGSGSTSVDAVTPENSAESKALRQIGLARGVVGELQANREDPLDETFIRNLISHKATLFEVLESEVLTQPSHQDELINLYEGIEAFMLYRWRQLKESAPLFSTLTRLLDYQNKQGVLFQKQKSKILMARLQEQGDDDFTSSTLRIPSKKNIENILYLGRPIEGELTADEKCLADYYFWLLKNKALQKQLIQTQLDPNQEEIERIVTDTFYTRVLRGDTFKRIGDMVKERARVLELLEKLKSVAVKTLKDFNDQKDVIQAQETEIRRLREIVGSNT